jgi:hypothetical protein
MASYEVIFYDKSKIRVEAEEVEYHEPDNDYTFFTEDEEAPVLIVPYHQVRYIQRVEDEDEENEDESVCTECVVKDILECELFQQGVADMVAALTSADEDHVPEIETQKELRLEHWGDGKTHQWGFQTDKGFVNFFSKEEAEKNRAYVQADSSGWSYLDLADYTKVEG